MSRLATDLIGFETIVRREVMRILRIWAQTILPPAITMTLYFIIFGNLIGRRIGEMSGFGYMEFIAPGLIMMSVINNSYANVVSSFFGAKFGRYIEELLVAPMNEHWILLGYVAGGVVRGLVVGAVVTIITLLFTRMHISNVSIVISAVLLSSTVFALAGMINAIFAKNFDQITFIPTFVLTPLTYLGGVFYSVTMLPPWAQSISHANPILYMVNAFRFGFLGVSDVNVGLAYTIMLAAAAVLYVACVMLLERGVGTRE